MNPNKLAIITKHGNKFVTKTKSVTDGVHYSADGSAIMTDRHRLLRIKDIHANTEPSTRCLTIADADYAHISAITKSITAIARAAGDREPIITIIDGRITYKPVGARQTVVSVDLTSDTVKHPPIAINNAYLTDALAVFKDAGSAEISVFVSGQMSPIVLYDDKVGVDMIVLPLRIADWAKGEVFESEAE